MGNVSQTIKESTSQLRRQVSATYHFPRDHNAPCLPPPPPRKPLFPISDPLGSTVVPREIQDNRYAKLWKTKCVLISVKTVNATFVRLEVTL